MVYCRPNYELYSRFASFGDAVIIIEPTDIRKRLQETLRKALDNYADLQD